MSICLTLVSFWWIRKTQVIPEYVVFFKKSGRLVEGVCLCEELVGVTWKVGEHALVVSTLC